MPPLLQLQEEERKREQKEARRIRIAECGLGCESCVTNACSRRCRYKRGDEMRSTNAANAEDRDYEQRLLKVGATAGRVQFYSAEARLFSRQLQLGMRVCL